MESGVILKWEPRLFQTFFSSPTRGLKSTIHKVTQDHAESCLYVRKSLTSGGIVKAWRQRPGSVLPTSVSGVRQRLSEMVEGELTS